MKIYISNYRSHWISPYTWLDWVFWWKPWSQCARYKGAWSAESEAKWVDRPEWCDTWADRLTPVSQAIQWVLDRVHPRIQYVKVDYWDTWSMDSTLSPIILKMLRQLQDTKHGSPNTDDEDVPEHLRSTAAPPKQNAWDTDANHHLRWDWILDEMIFAFDMKSRDDWTAQFHTGEVDIQWKPVDAAGNEVDKKDARWFQMERGPADTSRWDQEGQRRVQERITNGFRLFGKYYEALWD